MPICSCMRNYWKAEELELKKNKKYVKEHEQKTSSETYLYKMFF